jgi:hypothetical protein
MASEASVYLTQIEELAKTLESVIDDVPAGQFNQRPGPHLNPVGWNYFHLLRVWDMYFNWDCREQPPEEDAWHRGGFTEKSGYQPDGKGSRGLGIGFTYTDEEVDEIQIEPGILKQYQRMLLAETEAFLRDAGEDDLRRIVVPVLYRGETRTIAQRMRHLIMHSYQHVGEMRYAMGVLGWRDPSYPEARG